MLLFLNKYKILFSVSLLSAAIIAFQVALMQILSAVQWYHFAYMIISVALLGFGAAASVLSIFRARLLKHIDLLVPLLMIVTGISMTLVIDISGSSFVRFDTYLLFAQYSHIKKLLLTYLLFFIPFFFGALAIGLVFVHYVQSIGKIYFANLLGSGAGGLLSLALLSVFYSNQLPAIISILPLIAGTIIIHEKKKILQVCVALLGVLLIGWKIVQPPALVLSQYKDLSKTLLLPDAKIILEKKGPYGLLQAVSSPVLRYAPGLSLTATTTAEVKAAVFVNGDWFGSITQRNRTDSAFILDYTTMALPYIMAKRNVVLVLRSGTGMDVAHGLSRGATKIMAVEPNTTVVAALKNELVNYNDSLFYHPAVTVRSLEPRSFLLFDSSRFDLITLPMTGSFGGSAGLYALQEQFILTKEAFRDMWQKLNPGGVISISCWMDYPVRNSLKILATIEEVLEDLNIPYPDKHMAAIRSWGTISFAITKSPLNKMEIQNIRDFCQEMLFDPVILPGLLPGERSRFNQLQDTAFFDYVDRIVGKARNEFYTDYDFNIRPATDNKPYFSQFIKWESMDHLSGMFGNRSLPFLEAGYLLVIITLIQLVLVSFVLIIAPLFKTGWRGKNKLTVFLYFGGIAAGYMFVEMAFIQRFILYFGNPVYSVSAVISFLLIFSGVGSYVSGYFQNNKKRMLLITAGIVFILLLYAFILTPVLQQTINLDLVIKLLVVFLLIAPPAFLMGIPFPSGLLQLSKTNSLHIPWAWGINGCISVISTALVTIVAVEWGFMSVMLLAALSYCMPLLFSEKLK